MKLVSLPNKIFFKIGTVFAVIIIIYVLFTTFFIAPKITTYLVDFETKQAKVQLDRIVAIIETREDHLKEYKSLRTKEHRENIRNISFIAYNIMQNYYEMYQNGSLSKEDAIKDAFKIISSIKYGHEDDYIYILDRSGTLVFHPDKRYHKRNILNTKDAKGKNFVDKIIENSVKNKETYTTYAWSKLNSEVVSEKISHSLYFKPFDLIISSGVYIQNIKQELELEKEKVINHLDPLIKSIIVEDSGYIFVLNGKNKVVLHPDKNIIGHDVSFLREQGSNNLIVNRLKEAYKKGDPWEYKWNRLNDLENHTYDKIAWIQYNNFFDWYIVSSLYKDDLEVKAKEINQMIINISLVILIFLTIIAIIFIKRLLLPITILSKNADLVKSGNLEVRNNIQSDDELGSLANHFNKMLDFIEDNTKNLEQKVEERTAEIKHKLYYDELTGLKNRESLLKDLKEENFAALNLIDIDGFDNINELYGFTVGNEVLIKVTQLLKNFSTENDLELYRLESDIFIFLDTHLERFSSYDKFLQKIQDVFKKEILIDSLEIEVFLYVTIGSSISQTSPLKSANIALKKAKQSGMKYLVYNKSIDTKDNIKKMMYWREKIKTAINEDRIIPFFQPIFNKSGKLVKYETLMRIYDEVDHKPYYLSPGSFFEVAIKTKQYFRLNQEVIKKAFKSIDKIGVDISINLSFADIMNVDFIELIEKEVVKLSKEQRKKVVFEILESDHISDYEILDEFMFKFREKGIRIAIDDFGTGYSNFAHILKVKPNYIKIDGSLIKDINSDENSYEMVKSIVNFSKSLGITVIAEYIHSKEVYDIVKELDVDEFQGYFLGEPKPLI